LLPAVRAAGEDAVVLADGYSCRTQLEDLSERRGIHLAQLLDQATPRD
ncbi:Fe-S oxidoreductase, partial [Arthrobacter sp. CAN_A214]